MNRRVATRTILGAAAGLFFVSIVWRLAARADDFIIRNDVRLVLLDAAVVDEKGNFVSGLSKGDFRIEENGRPQTITAFENQDAPVTMGILVDESYSMSSIREQLLTAAQNLIKESNRRDEVFVLNFNDTVKRGLPDGVLFSDQIPQLGLALNRGFPEGRTALYDAVADGLTQLQSGRRGVKTLVVISDGGDTASHHKRRDTLDLVERSNATIFSVGLTGDADSDPGILHRFASISGGEALFPQGVNDVATECRRIARDVRARYTIGYAPPEKNGDSLRHIRVSIPGKPRFKVLARTSYQYEAAQQGSEK